MLRSLALILTASVALIGAEGWLTDHAAAMKAAKDGKKAVIMDFTGSDWCGWCVKLDKEVFSTPEFKAWAKDKVVLLEVDFPQGKPQSKELQAQNQKLQEQFKIEGYPTIVVTDASGKELGRLGYEQGGPAVWTASADKLLATKP
jgi:protein disulfide-isomerase